MPDRETEFYRRYFLGGLRDPEDREEGEEDEDDDDLLGRMTPVPARYRTMSSSPAPMSTATPAVETFTPAEGTTPRADLTPEFNRELRADYKNKPSPGRYFDQSPETRDFERTRRFVEDSARRVKPFPETDERHQSRKEFDRMRARTKGAQHRDMRQLAKTFETMYQGLEATGRVGTSERIARTAGRGVERAVDLGLRRLGPAAALYGAFEAGQAIGGLTPAAQRAKEREERVRQYEGRQQFLRDRYPGEDEDFYLSVAQEMMRAGGR